MNAPIDVTNIHIETDRLILRPWRESDLEDFFEYASVPGIGEMAGWKHHASLEESKTILSLFVQEKKTFALELKENGKVIGSLGLEDRDGDLDLPEEQVGRGIGYVLSKNYWSKGLMTEAVNAVIKYCFENLHYDWLICGHFLQNDRSRRVIEKSGFTYVQEIDFKTQMGTVERTKRYILYNPHKENHYV